MGIIRAMIPAIMNVALKSRPVLVNTRPITKGEIVIPIIIIIICIAIKPALCSGGVTLDAIKAMAGVINPWAIPTMRVGNSSNHEHL